MAERIAYTAYTQTCTFLLDEDGFCRRILLRGKSKATANAKAVRRCLGAQYVASLVLGEAGGLVQMPTVGAPLIFARIDEGRVSLVRTANLERFVSHDDVDGRERELASLARTEEVRAVRPSKVEPEELSPDELEDGEPAEDPDAVYRDNADRTHQLRHLDLKNDETILRGRPKKRGMLPKR